jgi:hypothetical protein
MNNHYEGNEDRDLIGSAMGLLGSLHPGIRSAVLLWAFLIGIAVLNSFTGGTSVVFCYPVQLLLYVGNGALASYFALNSGYHTAALPRVGAIAGLVAWVLPALFYLVFGFILGLVTFGIGFVGVATWVLCGPVDLAIQVTCGALGAWLYGHFTGEKAGDNYGPYQ